VRPSPISPRAASRRPSGPAPSRDLTQVFFHSSRGLLWGPMPNMCCGAVLSRANSQHRIVEGLALGTADSLASPTRLFSCFFILGIFVRIAESNHLHARRKQLDGFRQIPWGCRKLTSRHIAYALTKKLDDVRVRASSHTYPLYRSR
jgi:hypothetical protein